MTNVQRPTSGTRKGSNLERWLIAIRRALEQHRLLCHTSYEDRPGGDALALAVWTPQGLAELQIDRERRGGVLRLLAETVDAARLLASALSGLHRTIPRLKNAQRRFIHRIERMADHLVLTFAARAARFPQARLTALRGLVPGSAALVGLQATFRGRQERGGEELVFDDDASDARSARKARRYPTIYAASIDTPQGSRAARYQPERDAFFFAGAALGALGALTLGKPPELLRSAAVANDLDQQQAWRETGGTAETIGDVLEAGIDVANAASSCGDIGFDLPDCDVCDVPDCG